MNIYSVCKTALKIFKFWQPFQCSLVLLYQVNLSPDKIQSLLPICVHVHP